MYRTSLSFHATSPAIAQLQNGAGIALLSSPSMALFCSSCLGYADEARCRSFSSFCPFSTQNILSYRNKTGRHTGLLCSLRVKPRPIWDICSLLPFAPAPHCLAKHSLAIALQNSTPLYFALALRYCTRPSPAFAMRNAATPNNAIAALRSAPRCCTLPLRNETVPRLCHARRCFALPYLCHAKRCLAIAKQYQTTHHNTKRHLCFV